MRATHLWLAAVLGLMIAAAARAEASLIFSTFGPGDSFNTTLGFTVSGASSISGYNADANQFTPTTTAALGTIEVALFVFGPGDSVIVELTTDSAGRPGTVLESYTLTNLPFVPAQIVSIHSTLHTTLVGGTPYWLAILPGTSSTSGGWNDNSINAQGLFLQSHDPGLVTGPIQTLNQSAFRLMSAPEPSTLLLFVSGLAGLGRISWRRHRRK
jgi:hypothetical protein